MAIEAQQATAFGWKRELRVRTDDDLTLCVERLAPPGPCRGAVILCHGLASNGLLFDLPGRSLSRYLTQHNFECFIPDLRGARHSNTPDSGWGLDDYIERDLPAILQLVREQALSDQIHWVGHSMGGILMLMYGSEHPEVPIQRVVTLGSTLDYRPGRSFYHRWRHALPLVRPLRQVPFGSLAQLSGALSSRIQLPTERINFYRPNVEPEVVHAILEGGFGAIPTQLLADLSTTFEGGFARRGGLLPYADLWPRYRIPTLLIAGSRDQHCQIVAVDETARMLGHLDELTVKPMGRAHGHLEDYGHFDLVVGRNAAHEVWPEIAAWLSQGLSNGDVVEAQQASESSVRA